MDGLNPERRKRKGAPAENAGAGPPDEARTPGDDEASNYGGLAGKAELLALRLRHAERTRSATVDQCGQFTLELADRVQSYRAQKAWKLMLAVRVVYTALSRRGLLSAADAVRALLFQPSRRCALLASQELEFPRLSDYLPVEALQSFTAGLPQAALSDSGDLCELPIPRRLDIIIFAIIDFEFRFQRPQQIAVEFAARGHRVFWVSPGKVIAASSPVAYLTRRLRENLWEVQLRSPARDMYRVELDETTRQAQLSSLLEFFKDMEVAGHVLIVQLPFWRRTALALRELQRGPLLYDCMDDWNSFENISDFIRSEERMLVREADLVIATAAGLAAKIESDAKRLALVRNGADYGHFQGAAPHPELSEVAHPIIGYFGAIADWIDLDLVEESARRRPQYSFVLVGEVFGRDIRALERLPNVHLMGSRPYAEIPGFLASFDVCAIPFLVNAVTEATDPVKLYEYFCSGKPVVATRMSELSCWGDALYVADSASHYVELLDRAVGEYSLALATKRREIAKANTWAHRVDVITSRISLLRKRTSIVLVTYQSAAYIGLCLESILAYTEEPCYEVIVVDNGSTDGTVDAVLGFEKAGAPVRAIRLARNEGFAGGNNRGVESATGDYLVLLNPDTMVTPGWLSRLQWHLDDDQAIGLVCPVTNFAGNEARIEVKYRCAMEMEIFGRRRAKASWHQRSFIRMAPLFCGMMKTSLYRDVGGLDESYLVGMFEDDDLAQRIRQQQKTIACAEDCFVHHFGQGSFGALKPAEYEALFQRNRLTYEQRWKITWTPHVPREGVRPVSAAERYDAAVFAAEWLKQRGREQRSSVRAGSTP